MEIRRFLRILISRKWLVILTIDIAFFVAVLISVRTPPTYSATATVRVAQGANGGTSYQDVNYTERVVQTYVQLLASRPYLEAAIDRLKLPATPEQLAPTVKVDAVPNTELIRIGVENRDPRQATAIANALAGLLVEQGPKVYAGQGKSAQDILQEQLNAAGTQLSRDRATLATLSNGTSVTPAPGAQDLAAKVDAEQRSYATLLDQYDRARINDAIMANSISLVDPANTPALPSKPRHVLNALLGALLGAIGGLGLALFLEKTNPIVHTGEDIQAATDLPIIGRIPPFGTSGRPQDKLVVLQDHPKHATAAEALRRLSNNLLSLLDRQHLRQLLIVGTDTSANGAANGAAILVNLAVAMAEAGKQVILVDADLRTPSLHRFFGIKTGTGLVELIARPALLNGSLCETGVRGLRLLPAGTSTADPARLLTPPALAPILQKLPAQADVVLWYSPVAASALASLLAARTDGVVLIVRQDQTSVADLMQEAEELRHIEATPLGVIFNGAIRDGGSAPRYVPATAGTMPVVEAAQMLNPVPSPVPNPMSGPAPNQASAADGSVVTGSAAPQGQAAEGGNHNLTSSTRS